MFKKRGGKRPHNDLAITTDGTKDVILNNRTWKEDPQFFLRRV